MNVPGVVSTGVLTANTTRTTGTHLATASATAANLAAGVVSATGMQSNVSLDCTGTFGLTPTLTGSSTFTALSAAGVPINVTDPSTTDLAVGKLTVNAQESGPTSLTQRALAVTVAGVPLVTAGEATISYTGNPCIS